MKKLLLSAGLLVLGPAAALASSCLPGSLQSYFALGAAGCQAGAVLFSNFELAPGQSFAVPLDPAAIQVVPGGTMFNPTLAFVLDTAASSGDLFESFFRFNATGPLSGASIGLASAAAAGDGAVTGVLDLCPNGFFAGLAPLGCTTSPTSRVVFAIEGSSLLSDSAALPGSSFFDVFVDLTIDGGLSGSASLGSATVGLSAVPEPSTALLIGAGLVTIGALRLRRAL